MERARSREPARRRPSFVVTETPAGSQVMVVDDKADSLDFFRRLVARWQPGSLVLDNTVCRRPRPGWSGRGKVERAFRWLEAEVIFGRRRRRRPGAAR